MKKILFFAALMLGMVSCQTEPEGLDVIVGGEQEVMLNVSLPESTRSASSAGFDFTYFESNGQYDLRFILEIAYNGTVVREVKTSETTSTTFPVRLVPGRNYTFTVWADLVNEGSQADLYYNILSQNKANNESVLENIMINIDEWTPNVEARDAYYGRRTLLDTESIAQIGTITLFRPFAKVRVVATDIADVRKFGIEPNKATVTYRVPMYTAFDAVNGTVTGSATTISSPIAYDIVADAYTENTNELTVFADYIFVPEGGNIQFDLNINQDGDLIKSNSFSTAIPVEVNKVTSIVGDVLTEGGNVSITVDSEHGEKETINFVDTAESLQKAINNAEDNKSTSIKLGDDVVIGDTTTRAEQQFGLVIPAGKIIVLDLNGKRIFQEKACSSSYSMIQNAGNLTITGEGTIEFTNTAEGGSSAWGTYTIENRGKAVLIIDNATIRHNGCVNGEVNRDTNIAIQNYQGKVVVNGGTIASTQFRSLRDFTAGGEIIINGGTFLGQVWMQGLGNGSSSLTINGGNFSPVEGYDGSSVYITNSSNIVNVAVKGGMFNTKIGCYDANKEGAKGCITAGEFTTTAKENTNAALLAEGYVFASGDNDNWIVEGGAYEWINDTTCMINNASGLVWFANEVNGSNNFNGKTVKLANNIDLAGIKWTPIGMSTDLANGKTFRGTFDGDGKTISNMTCENADAAGLFGYIYAATIKNVTIENAVLKSNHYAGGIVNWVLNTTGNIKVPFVMENCHVENSTIASTPEEVNGNYDNGDKVGGLIGYANINNEGAGINNCSVENTSIKAYRDFGGFIGYAKGVIMEDCTITNVTLEQDTTNDYQTTTPTTFGMIIGRDECGNIIDGAYVAANKNSLQHAIDNNYNTIKLIADIVGDVTVIQKPGVKITIDGDGNKFNGSIKVHSNSEHYANAALTIKNVNFETSAASINVIEALENGAERYSTNITVEDCSFTATGEAVNTSVGVQIKSSKNAKVLNCTATYMHSLIQAQSCDESVEVKGCTINGKNGVAFKQVKAATVEGTTITALEYGIRFDGNTDNYGIVVKNNKVTANQPLIVRKMTGKNNTITLEGTNTLTTEAEYQIVITNGSDDEEYVKPTGTYTLTGAEGYSYFPAPPVAKVGNTEYTNIDEAIAAWTDNTTLTLVSDVTLNNVITLKSTEYHILDLGTYTLTAAKGKDAISITAEGRTSASYALDIKADATNPGGITATSKAVVKTTGKSGVKDRPIIRFYNGVYNASNVISHSGSNGTNCPQFQFHNGVYNANLSANRALIQIYGGTFNGKFYTSVDSSAYMLISGGKFKYLDNLYSSALNSDKFTIGSSKGNFDRGVYVDDEGYIVVGGAVITEFGDMFKAKATNASKAGSYLPYSSAAEHGLYYTNADLAIQKHGEANVVLK